MELVTAMILLVFAVLQIILFFKIWGMTNDVKTIKDSLLAKDLSYHKTPPTNSSLLNIGDLVVNKEGKQMRIKEIQDGKYACYTNGGTHFEGLYEESDIKPFAKS